MEILVSPAVVDLSNQHAAFISKQLQKANEVSVIFKAKLLVQVSR